MDPDQNIDLTNPAFKDYREQIKTALPKLEIIRTLNLDFELRSDLQIEEVDADHPCETCGSFRGGERYHFKENEH